MKTADRNDSFESVVNDDLHQLILHGRQLHDQAVFDVLTSVTKISWTFVVRALATVTGGAKLKQPNHRRVNA